MRPRHDADFLAPVAGLALLVAGCGGDTPAAAGRVLRVGHFPNVTHAHGLVAHSFTREAAGSPGQGWLESRLGPDVRVEWFTYNAGPSAMEAILSGAVDLTYVGPSPALNAHLKSRGEEIRVIAGATRGGSALVVKADGGLRSAADLRGKRVATPQLGNTQDVACRAWLLEQGFRVTQTGGDVHVVPTQNPDQLALFREGALDAVWTVEPWVSRLETEAGGRILVEEPDVLTTCLVASARFLREAPDLARRFARAHAELTEWIREHEEEAKERVRAELAAETSREMARELVDRCWSRMRFTDEVDLAVFEAHLKAAQKVGFLKGAGDVARLVEIPR